MLDQVPCNIAQLGTTHESFFDATVGNELGVSMDGRPAPLACRNTRIWQRYSILLRCHGPIGSIRPEAGGYDLIRENFHGF